MVQHSTTYFEQNLADNIWVASGHQERFARGYGVCSSTRVVPQMNYVEMGPLTLHPVAVSNPSFTSGVPIAGNFTFKRGKVRQERNNSSMGMGG